ncbi:MAG: CtsR family transcriptional regulator [Christensenellales bacterium]
MRCSGMRLLSDSIEDFIKALMEDEQDQQQAIELRRNELAEHFQCAPSQINYVLATRFTPDHGYVIESCAAASAISASCGWRLPAGKTCCNRSTSASACPSVRRTR